MLLLSFNYFSFSLVMIIKYNWILPRISAEDHFLGWHQDKTRGDVFITFGDSKLPVK